MPRNATETAGERKSGVRQLLRIILLLADDYRPADKMSMREVLGIMKAHLIKTALKETSGNATAAGEVLRENRTTIVEHFRRRGSPNNRDFFQRRRKRRWSKKPTNDAESITRSEEE